METSEPQQVPLQVNDSGLEMTVPQPIPDMPQAPPTMPEVIPANATEGGREISDTILYVGNLNKSVTEEVLRELFSVGGEVQSIKILYDKNQHLLNYAFVEFDNTEALEIALQNLNGSLLEDVPIRVNWAYQSQQLKNTDTFNVFVGDLSPEVNDEGLGQAFSRFQSLIQAHVMWDMQTGRSRGYGFVSFGDQVELEIAIQTMNGEWIAGRSIRLNWATHKQHQPYPNYPHRNNYKNSMMLQQQMAMAAAPQQPQQTLPQQQPMMSPQNFEMVLRQAPAYNTTVYLGNLSHYTSQNDLIPLLQQFGFIVDFKFHPERGCAFVKFDSHERAAMAIMNLNGLTLNGRQIKSNWGKSDLRNGYKQAPVPMPQMYPGQRYN